MRPTDDFRAADSREEILVATGEADDFVREDRAADQHVVVVEDVAVNADRDGLVQQAAGDAGDFILGDLPQFQKCLGQVPAMVRDF